MAENDDVKEITDEKIIVLIKKDNTSDESNALCSKSIYSIWFNFKLSKQLYLTLYSKKIQQMYCCLNIGLTLQPRTGVPVN